MHRARVEKHRFGGAMRQAGIVAAAGLYALDHNVERLALDHQRARRLAVAWSERGLPVELERVQTNFVQVDVAALGLGEYEAVERLTEAGVLLSRTMRAGVLAGRDAPRRRRRGHRRRRRARSARAGSRGCPRLSSSRRSSSGWSRSGRPTGCRRWSAAVVRKGELVWSGAAGTANYAEERAATPETQYRIGSITKTFTATAIMQLRDAGALDLDDRLDQHITGSRTVRRRSAACSPTSRACSGRRGRCS